MIGVSLILWLTAFLVVFFSRRLTGDFLSPGAIFLAAWATTAGLYALFLLPYIRLERSSAFLIAAAAAALVVGVCVGQWAMKRRETSGKSEKQELPEGIDKWIALYSALGWLGFLWYASLAIGIFGLSGVRHGWQIRWALSTRIIPSGFLFLEFFCIISPVVTLASLLGGARIKRSVVVGSASCLLPLWLTTDRTQFFIFVLTGMWIYLMRFGPELRLGRYLAVIALCCGLLILNFLVVGRWVGKTPENLGARLDVERLIPSRAESGVPAGVQVGRGVPRVSPLDTAIDYVRRRGGSAVQRLSTLYVYATCSYPAISELLQDEPSRTWGRRTFFPVFRLLQKLRLYSAELPDAIPPFRRISKEAALATNAYSFLRDPFLDFGTAGVVLFPLLIGLIAGVLYGRVRVRRSQSVALIWLGLLCMGLSLSVLFNKFNDTATWYIGVMASAPFLVSKWYEALKRRRAGLRRRDRSSLSGIPEPRPSTSKTAFRPM